MKIAILVEGETERVFKPFLEQFLRIRLQNQMPRLKFIKYDGRIPKRDDLKRRVEILLTDNHAFDAVIALTDVYTGTNDFIDATDAKAKMTEWVGGNPNFYPHVAAYDFEAWLIPFWNTIQKLAQHNKTVPNGPPEEVNHNNPPSKRIQEIFRIGKRGDSYVKPRDALRILRENPDALAISANVCPELKAFLNRLLSLSGGIELP